MPLNAFIQNRKKHFLNCRINSLTIDENLSVFGNTNLDTVDVNNVDVDELVVNNTADINNADVDNLVVNDSLNFDQKQGTFTVYQNYESGDDANDGLTSGTAVKKLNRAIQVLANYSYETGKIIMQGNLKTTIEKEIPEYKSLFNDTLASVIDFTILTGKYSNVIVEAEPATIDIDTSTLGSWGPSNQWDVVTNAGSGYTPDQFRYFPVYNETQDEYLTIASNTATDINLIGAISVSDVVKIIDHDNFNGQIEPTAGRDLFILSNIPCTLRYVFINYGSAAFNDGYSYCPLVPAKLEGCRIDFSSGAVAGGRFFGDWVLQGCGSFSRVSNASRNVSITYANCCLGNADGGQALSNATKMNATYIYRVGLQCNNVNQEATLNQVYVDASNAGNNNDCLSRAGGEEPINLYMTSCLFEAYNGNAINLSSNSHLYIDNCTLSSEQDKAIVTNNNVHLTFDDANSVTANNDNSMLINKGSLYLVDNCSLTVNSFDHLELSSSLFSFGTGTSLSITTMNSGMLLRYGSEWKGSTSAGFTFNCTDEAVKLESGSTMANSVNFVNSGAGADFKCGGNGGGALTTQNDLGAGVPQNCFAYID